jgi:hypothetical protein
MVVGTSRLAPQPVSAQTLVIVRTGPALAVLLLALALASPARAQQPADLPSTPRAASGASPDRQQVMVARNPQTQAVQTSKPADLRLTRWLDLQTVTLYARFRFVQNSAGVTTVRQLQHKEAIRGRLKLDRPGKYSLNFGVFSGKTFTSSWDATGWGTGDAQGYLALKQLYVAARPLAGLEVQYGGLYIIRGESTEISTYDEDGFIVGGRTSVRRPDKLFFDEVSLTFANLGDVATPNLTKRLRRLDTVNYRHLLADKRIGKRAALSVDYTNQAGRGTIREAVSITTPELRVAGLVRLENYQRVAGQPASGFVAYGEKAIRRRLVLGAGYARIDRFFGGLNGDRYGVGNRLYVFTTLTTDSGFVLQSYVTRALGTAYPIPQRLRVDVVFSYNLLKPLQRTPLFHPALSPPWPDAVARPAGGSRAPFNLPG